MFLSAILLCVFWAQSCADKNNPSQSAPENPQDTRDALPPSAPPSRFSLSPQEQIENSTITKLIGGDVNLLDWNEDLPRDVASWVKLLDDESGKISGLLIPFSMAPQYTSLEKPRIVLTAPEGSPQRGRFFVAIAEHEDREIVEFISWNPARAAFDFGTIERSDEKQKVSFAHEPTCFACHRTRSPIFPNEAWDNTVINRSVLAAFVEKQAEQGTPGFEDFNQKMQVVLEKDRLARLESPPNVDDFIDTQMQYDDSFSDMTYKGFPFVDAMTEQSFDFNQAIFDAHTLIVATDWLQTLPDQTNAARIANEHKTDLIDEYPFHYRTLATFNSPYLLNFNIVAKQVNHFHSLEDVIPTEKNVKAVLDYNNSANSKQKHVLPPQHQPTATIAFEHNHVDWRDYMTPEIIKRAFQKGDPSYKPREILLNKEEKPVSHKQLCRSCHNGTPGSPNPSYWKFNPLIESDWTELLETDKQKHAATLCLTLKRISSETAPMPPQQSREAKSFQTYRDTTILSLETLVNRHSLNCD